MPRRDPITGCEVVTLPEFLAHEADREGQGRSGGEILGEIIADLDADSKREEARLRDPVTALATLRERVTEWNAADPDLRPLPLPVRLVAIEEVKVKQGFRSSGLTLIAHIVTAGRRHYRVTVTESHYSGSFYEPPDQEVIVIYDRLPVASAARTGSRL